MVIMLVFVEQFQADMYANFLVNRSLGAKTVNLLTKTHIRLAIENSFYKQIRKTPKYKKCHQSGYG